MSLWYLLDTTHPDYESLIAAMRADHETRGPQIFSNIINLDGTKSFAKVQGASAGDYESDAILALYTADNHNLCPPLITPEEWEVSQ